ncbi:MAG: hypothetical protein K2P14_10275 [Anaeroplasmataceae bacterium]|nr:hypothetical protein [Anaeroplasmataceae bacterium]
MADQLVNKLQEIYNNKVENLRPENLVQGITCLGVEGIFEGFDTSDADAKPNDLAQGKIAYTDEGKIIGNVTTVTGIRGERCI